MCKWCILHGDGKVWYKNAKNYARKLYKLRKEKEREKEGRIVNPQEEVERLIQEVADAFSFDREKYEKLKPKVERILHSVHFGQVVPLQDMLDVLDICHPIARMTCACRRRIRGLSEEENWYCMGVGVGMYKWERWPESYKGGVEWLAPKEAKEWITELNRKGVVHTLWTFGTPYIGGICNCEYPSCLGIRNRLDYDLRILIKGEWVAKIDYKRCKGCGNCAKRCQFGAIKMEVSMQRANIDQFKCFGCGLCETGCERNAISLVPRNSLPLLKNVW
jgi:ferredoxin